MSAIEQLQREKDQLEARVIELVEQLEAKKGPKEMKVDKGLVFRSKEERDASAALEQLDLNDQGEPKSRLAATAKQVEAKKTEKKGGKQKGVTKEPAAPERPVDVSRLDLRVGKILEVSLHPDADSLYVEKIECGDPTGPRTVISGLVKHVPIDEMKDRLVVVLCNLKPAKMRGILSEAMVMCASTPEKVELVQVPQGAKPGDRVLFEGFPGEPDSQLNPKKKIWETVSPDVKTNNEGVAMYKDCEFKVLGVDGKFRSNLKNVNIR